MEWEIVCGLEIHVELATETKAYCSCKNSFGAPVNTQACEICTSMPGVLPVLNEKVVEFAVRVGKAIGCSINLVSHHDRKNYFYSDLPRGYQITQQATPICEWGTVNCQLGGRSFPVRVRRIHIEEDTGKLLHESGFSGTLIDFNRCGVPLIEIVTEPDFRSSEEAYVFLETMKGILVELGVSDGKMQEGSIRCDVNVSVRPSAQSEYGTRIEMKNVSTFSGAKRAIDYEAQRQIKALEAGEKLYQETRRWDDALGVNTIMRTKENANDYRYFPEADLPPIVITQEYVEAIQIPELAYQRLQRYSKDYGLSEFDAGLLSERSRSEYFEKAIKAGGQPKALANWINGELFKLLSDNERDFSTIALTPQSLCELLGLVQNGTISNTAAKQVLENMYQTGKPAMTIVNELGLAQLSDEDALSAVVDEILALNQPSVEAYKAGKSNALGFLVGQCMKASKGKGNPAILNKLLKEKLDA